MAAVQQVAYGGFGTTHDITVTAVGSGNGVIVIFKMATSVSLTSVTDNQGNTYTEDLSFAAVQSNTHRVYSSWNITDGPVTITITTGSATSVNGFVQEASGRGSAPTVDTSSVASGSGNTVTDTQTVSNADAHACGMVQFTDAEAFTPNTGYSRLPASGSQYELLCWDDDVGSGSQTLGGTSTTNPDWSLSFVAYSVAAGGGASIIVPTILRNYRHMGAIN